MLRLRVREVAEAKGVSMNKLSQRSEISYNIVRALFHNPYHVIRTDTLDRLALALDVPVTELIEDVSPEQRRRELEQIGS